MTPPTASLPPGLIEDALARILSGRDFKSSVRKRRFLEFVVRETLAGNADRIKAYAVAIDVFDRDPSFDPLTDPVVRIEAGRLRRCLERYYLTEGTDDPVLITIPKGSYVPAFTLKDATLPAPPEGLPARDGPREDRPQGAVMPPAGPPPAELLPADRPVTAPPSAGAGEAAAAPPAPAPWRPAVRRIGRARRWTIALCLSATGFLAVWLAVLILPLPPFTEPAGAAPAPVARGPTLLILPFATGSDDRGGPQEDEDARSLLADGFTEELVGELIQVQNLVTFGADTSFRYRSEEALRAAVPEVAVDYVLTGRIARSGGSFGLDVALLRASDRSTLWSDSVRRSFTPSAVNTVQQDIVAQVAAVLSAIHAATPKGGRGAIARRAGHTAGLNWPESLATYECMLANRHYRRHRSADRHELSRSCLERAIRNDPRYADAWAALALVYIDEARFGFNPSPARPDPVDTALRLARHAADLEPDNPLPHKAVGLAHWLRRETPASISAYERARALSPQDGKLLAALGRCHSFAGDWKRGIPLIREAFARNPAEPNRYRLTLVLFHYVHGRYAEALTEARKVDRTDPLYAHVALAMIHGQTGRSDEAAREVREILRLDPDFGKKAVPELERRNLYPTAITQVADGLAKAGLAIAPVGAGVADGL